MCWCTPELSARVCPSPACVKIARLVKAATDLCDVIRADGLLSADNPYLQEARAAVAFAGSNDEAEYRELLTEVYGRISGSRKPVAGPHSECGGDVRRLAGCR